MDYKELYEKAKKDLERVKLQKEQTQEKIKSLITQLDLDENQPLDEQIDKLKQDLEVRQKELTSKLDSLAAEINKFSDEL